MDKKFIVSKFGGSSVKDAQSMMYCVDIVKNLPRPTIVVISATWNTTNMLEDIARASIKGDIDYLTHQFQVLSNRHDKIAKDLFIYDDVKDDLNKLYEEAFIMSASFMKKKEFSPQMMDALYSIGERLSSILFAGSLNYTLGSEIKSICFDVRDVMITDSNYQNANPDMLKTKQLVDEKMLPLLKDDTILVTQGFIGKDEEGHTTTLGREGSDFTGSILASLVDASEYYVWTDVNGVKFCDPKKVEGAKTLKTLSYREAEVFATLGAKVLFPRTMEPVKDKMIPIFVGSTRDPQGEGTWIRSSNDMNLPIVGFTTDKVDNHLILSVVGKQAGTIDLTTHFNELQLKTKNAEFASYQVNGEIDYQKLYELLSKNFSQS